MITFLLAEAEVEALPAPVMIEGKAIRVLDASTMEAEGRRGRPDAVLAFVGPILASSAFQEGRAGLMVHTRDGRLIEFHPGALPPEGRLHFLIELTALYDTGVGFAGRATMRASSPIAEEMRRFPHVIVMSPIGKKRSLRQAAEGEALVVVGGFTSGELSPEVFGQADAVLSLGDEYLTLDLVARLLLDEITSRAPASSARP
jgi:rRNA pseudouridine-1189 N-methylase Emg1 (Nep1/Mra1 family)